MSTADFNSIFSRLEKLSLTSSLPAVLPDFSHYEYLATASDSQFIYFTRLSRYPPSYNATTETDQQYYVPFFTDNYHTLLHEIANYYELTKGIQDIKSLNVKAEGTEMDGGFAELDLGRDLEGIDSAEKWEAAKGKLAQMGFGSSPPDGLPQMGEGVVVVVEVA